MNAIVDDVSFSNFQLTTLRTREMRQRDELQRSYRYKYTLLRIRFPNRFFLQVIDIIIVFDLIY